MICMGTGIRAQAAQARKKTILDAALDLFLEKGFGAATLELILERSNASVGSFYQHFQGKVNVAAALYLETLESYQRAFLNELSRHREARGGIEGTVRHHLKWTAQKSEPGGAFDSLSRARSGRGAVRA